MPSKGGGGLVPSLEAAVEHQRAKDSLERLQEANVEMEKFIQNHRRQMKNRRNIMVALLAILVLYGSLWWIFSEFVF